MDSMNDQVKKKLREGQAKTPGVWYRDGAFVYILQETPGVFFEGKPLLSNRFNFCVQGKQTPEAILEAELMAQRIVDLLNKFP
jgi:hypothetical protein